MEETVNRSVTLRPQFQCSLFVIVYHNSLLYINIPKIIFVRNFKKMNACRHVLVPKEVGTIVTANIKIGKNGTRTFCIVGNFSPDRLDQSIEMVLLL